MPGEAEWDRIILCESRVQADELLRRGAARGKGVQVIAANPDAGWSLGKCGIPFIPLDDLHQNRSSEELEVLLREQVRWAGAVDRLLQENVPEFAEADFQPARYSLYYLKNSWDTCIHRAELLENLAREYHPGQVCYWKAQGALDYDGSLAPKGSVLSACITPWAAHHGIGEDPSPADPADMFWEIQDDRAGTLDRIALALRPWMPGWLASPLIRWRGGRRGIPQVHAGGREKGNPAIIVREQYDITGEVCSRLRDAGFNLVPFDAVMDGVRQAGKDGGLSPPVLSGAWEAAAAEDWFWKPGGWQAWSLRPLLEPLFRTFWFPVVPALWKATRAAAPVLGRIRPGALVTGTIDGPDEAGLVMAARHAGIPVVFYAHGASMGDIGNLAWDVTDRMYADVMLVYGPGPAAYIASRPPLPGRSAVPVPVGSARLDALRDGPGASRIREIRERIGGDSGKPVVLYVPGVLFSNYFRYDQYHMRPSWFFQVRRDVAGLLRGHPEVQFAYKAFISAGRDPTLEMLGRACPGCRVVRDIPLGELQWACDLLLHEIPSTGMYEGLMTGRRLIVYADEEIFTMAPGAARLLGLRASIATGREEFLRMVEGALEKGSPGQPAPEDRGFIREYCTHLDDGASAVRAAEEMGRIAKRAGRTAPPGF
jgi:hypothetical protein